MNKIQYSLIKPILLALILLLAQGQLIAHHLDVDAHVGSADCDVCVQLNILGSAVACDLHFTVLPITGCDKSYFTRLNQLIVDDTWHQSPRSPPTVS